MTFLDRLHRQLGEAVADETLRAELVRLWWLRRRRPRANVTGSVAGAGHVAHLVQEVVCQKMDPNWRESYGAVSRVLRGTVRASSAVECMNSVLRMHQSRHRTVSQGLLDLKRLYWNCREFREGKRRQHCPYELLGLKLPSYRFWDLLGMPTTPRGRGLTSKSVKFQTYDLGRSLPVPLVMAGTYRNAPSYSNIIPRSNPFHRIALSSGLGNTGCDDRHGAV